MTETITNENTERMAKVIALTPYMAHLGMEFVEGYREANAPKRPSENASAPELASERETRPSPDTARRIVGDRNEADRTPPRRHAAGPRPASAPTLDPSALHGGVLIVEGTEVRMSVAQSSLSEAMLDCQGDAPACDVCGTITVRNGSCYRCLNCGHSMGCS